MKLPEIKKLVENHSIEDLAKVEEEILEGLELSIEVGGADEGEQLTHVMAAMAILQDMKANGTDFREAFRTYTKRVRDSIS
jgi:hypothetical protein